MNVNAESRFAEIPKVDLPRSIFDHSAEHITAFNVGQLIPFYVDEVIPGSTFKVTTSFVARLQTLLTPIMGNLYLDIAYYFVPMRLLWEHWKNFMGESDRAWTPSVTYQVPQVTSPTGGWNVGTIADYLGIPTGIDNLSVSALPFRAVAMIANEWYRDQNLIDPLVINTGDATQTGSNGSGLSDLALGGLPFKAAKFHDRLTSALPAPQKGPTVSFDLLSGNLAPVGTGDVHKSSSFGGKEMNFMGVNYSALSWTDGSYHALFGKGNTEGQGDLIGNDNNNTGFSYTGLVPTNLWADLSTSIGSVNINDLRLAFQMQKWYERAARGGSRYRETLLAHFGVHSPDARMMIPEYLGGNRTPISIHQITNTSESVTAKLGDLGAMSNTSGVHEDFIKSFTEHGYVIGVATVRYDHLYPQALERMWSRKDMFDFYWPELANVGETPIFKREIMATGTSTDDQVFGYNEAWSDYRYKQSRVSSIMRPGVAGTLASWHLADHYASVPTLSQSWIEEDLAPVDRCLAVTSAVSNQLIADFYVKNTVTAPMPLYSVPGLIDHH